MENKFRLRTQNGKIIINPIRKTDSNKINLNCSKSISFNENKVTLQDNGFKTFKIFYDEFNADILSMHTTEKNMNKIYCAFEQLICNYDLLLKNLLPERLKTELDSVFTAAKNFVIDKFEAQNTSKKRQEVLENTEYYVKPTDYAIGLTWKSKNSIGSDITQHKLFQTAYQYVSIIDTIKSLFTNDQFHNSYFDFNQNKKHECIPGKYEDFCCGSIYNEHEVFTPTTIQLQLGMDEFEPCNALKSKSGLHKMCAIYLEIRNIDPKLKSKLSNIHLVALIKSLDLKADTDAADKVANRIVDELSILETTGITIKSGENLKGVLINVSSDNLGANGVFGFVESFVATFFCRICELNSTECKTQVEEISEKLRRKSTYAGHVDSLENSGSKNPDYKISKGVKKYCVYNRLSHFHIFDNCSVDIMHDLNEGVIRFFIKFLFDHIHSSKISTFDKLIAMCRDYNYGWSYKKNQPSIIKIDRANLNQNAMQTYCLMLHLPYILIEFKPKLGSIWRAMECLLQSLQILYSNQIRHCDIDRLRILLKEHLSFLVENGANLLPKHHMTTHYPTLIQKIGPLIHSWMMRFECKHKMFTDLVHLTYNYQNLPFTLAKRHQAKACADRSRAFNIRFEPSKTSYDFTKCAEYSKHHSKIIQHMGNSCSIKGVTFLYYGSLELRVGLFIIENAKVFELGHILVNDSNNYFVLCHEYRVKQFDFGLNSIEIEVNYDCIEILKVLEIKSQKSYDKKYSAGKMFIIADSLDVFANF